MRQQRHFYSERWRCASKHAWQEDRPPAQTNIFFAIAKTAGTGCPSAETHISRPLDQSDLVVATPCAVPAWISRNRRRSCPETHRPHAPFQPLQGMQPRFSARSPPESQPTISLFFVPRGATPFTFLSARHPRSAMGGGRPLVDNIDRSSIPEICQGVLIFREGSDHRLFGQLSSRTFAIDDR
jgi:hypothetical protein